MRGQFVEMESRGLLSIKKSILLKGVDCGRVGRAVGRRLRVDKTWQGRGGDVNSVSLGWVPLLPLSLCWFASNLEVTILCGRVLLGMK